jgi:hypothetical protein
VEALGKVDAVCPEERQGLLVLEPLRYRLETERLGQTSDGGDYVAVGRIRGEVAHEVDVDVDVDLDVGERQVLPARSRYLLGCRHERTRHMACVSAGGIN